MFCVGVCESVHVVVYARVHACACVCVCVSIVYAVCLSTCLCVYVCRLIQVPTHRLDEVGAAGDGLLDLLRVKQFDT